jgi:hypothetical protein
MPTYTQVLRLVVASPGDVKAERSAVSLVADELNKSVFVDLGVRLEVVRWEIDAYPGLHPAGAQGLIDPILRIEDCDILVGIFWKRFGTPLQRDASGTAHEFRLAYEAWLRNGRPQVMVYFKEKPYFPKSKEEVDQWGQVLEFQRQFPEQGLWWPYKGIPQFKELLRQHLVRVVRAQFPQSAGNQAAIYPPVADSQTVSTRSQPRPEYFKVQPKIVAEYDRTFVGRERVQKAFEEFLESHLCGYFILQGSPGQGKTAICCHLVKSRGYVHHFIARTASRTDSRLILRSLIAQLLPLAELDQNIPESIPELTKLYEEVLHLAAARQKRVVIVIDGLDELPTENTEALPYLMRDVVSDGVFYLVASRPGDCLDRLRGQLFAIPTKLYELGPLVLSEMSEILQAQKPDLSAADIERIAEVSQGNPLYLRTVADQLGLNPAYDLHSLPNQIEDFFRNAIGGLTRPNSVLSDVLALLSTARTPISLIDAANILGISQRETYDLGIRPIRQFLLELDDRYTFYHARFHEFVCASLLYDDELRKSHSRIASWLQRPENRDADIRWNSLAFHLFESGSHEALVATIDEKFLAEKARHSGYAVLEDVELLTRCLLELGDPAIVERCVSIVEGLRKVVGSDIIPSAMNVVQPYQPGPPAFRTRLLSPSVPSVPGLDVFVGVLPKVEVAADFFELVPLGSHLALAIGDAPSVGIKSAFVARFLGNLFKSCVGDSRPVDLAQILTAINAKVAASDYFERISMQCADFDPIRGIAHLANAGHPYPVRYSARRKKCDILPLRGDLLHNPIARRSSPQPFEQYGLEIEPGDILVFITDGLTEGHLLQGHPFGYRFTDIVEASSQESARAIGERILDVWRGYPREEDTADDVSVIVVKIRADVYRSAG